MADQHGPVASVVPGTGHEQGDVVLGPVGEAAWLAGEGRRCGCEGDLGVAQASGDAADQEVCDVRLDGRASAPNPAPPVSIHAARGRARQESRDVALIRVFRWGRVREDARRDPVVSCMRRASYRLRLRPLRSGDPIRSGACRPGRQPHGSRRRIRGLLQSVGCATTAVRAPASDVPRRRGSWLAVDRLKTRQLQRPYFQVSRPEEERWKLDAKSCDAAGDARRSTRPPPVADGGLARRHGPARRPPAPRRARRVG